MNKEIERLNSEVRELKRKNGIKAVWIFMIIMAGLISLCFSNGLGRDVDEKSFCLEKISKHFPEYSFSRAELRTVCPERTGNNAFSTCDEYYYLCDGYVNNPEVQRDGLRTYNPDKSIISFELINESDKDYVDSDDWPNFLVGLGWVLSVIYVGAMIMMISSFIIGRNKK